MVNTRGESSTPKPTKYPDLRTILKTCDSVEEAPEFSVLNAEVWTRDGRECVDLLETNLRGPFRVQGTLQDEKGGEKSCEFEFSISILDFWVKRHGGVVARFQLHFTTSIDLVRRYF